MQVRESSPELGKVIGLHAEPMLFCSFDGKLAKACERACNRRIHRLLDLFEGDPLGSVGANLVSRAGSVAAELAGGRGVWRLRVHVHP